MRPPIYSDQEIFDAGEALVARLGREVSATEIHKSLGAKGNVARIRGLWEAHQETRDEAVETEPLSEDLQAKVAKATATLQQTVENIFRQQIAQLTEQHVRQFSLLDRDVEQLKTEHAKEVQRLQDDNAYTGQYIEELEAVMELTSSEEPESSQPPPQTAGRDAPVPAAVRKSPNRPMKKTRPAVRKPGLPAPRSPN